MNQSSAYSSLDKKKSTFSKFAKTYTLYLVAEIRAEIVWDSDERMAAKIVLNEAVFFSLDLPSKFLACLQKEKIKSKNSALQSSFL